jgi:hypothetical protein
MIPWWGWLVILVVFVGTGVAKVRTANHDYTAGSGMFKRDDNNLEKDKHLDVSDYDYYNKKGKLK